MEPIVLNGKASKITFYDDHYEVSKLLSKNSISYDNVACVCCDVDTLYVFNLVATREHFKVGSVGIDLKQITDKLNEIIVYDHVNSMMWKTYNKNGFYYYKCIVNNIQGCLYISNTNITFSGIGENKIELELCDLIGIESHDNLIEFYLKSGEKITFNIRCDFISAVLAKINENMVAEWESRKMANIYRGESVINGMKSIISIDNRCFIFNYNRTDYKITFDKLQYVESFGDILAVATDYKEIFDIKIPNFTIAKKYFDILSKPLDIKELLNGKVVLVESEGDFFPICFEKDRIISKDEDELIEIDYSDIKDVELEGGNFVIKEFCSEDYILTFPDRFDTSQLYEEICSFVNEKNSNSKAYARNIATEQKDEFIHTQLKSISFGKGIKYYPETGMLEIGKYTFSYSDLIDIKVEVDKETRTVSKRVKDNRNGKYKSKNITENSYRMYYVVIYSVDGLTHSHRVYICNAKDASDKTRIRSEMEIDIDNVKARKKSYEEYLDEGKVSELNSFSRESYVSTDKYKVEKPDKKEKTEEIDLNKKSNDKGTNAKDTAPKTSAIDKLNALIGLENVKRDVSNLVNLIQVNKLREENGLKATPVSLHLVFSGNPGTGKTTVARILAEIYKELGVIKKGQLVEVDRSGLVAGYTGQTAIKTKERVLEALGGILFIDEAYTLLQDNDDSFGKEAIDTVLKLMEDYRDELVVIVAGYTDEMKRFIDSNPGLKSRFSKYIEFDDYNKDQMLQIFNKICEEHDYNLTEDASAFLNMKIDSMLEKKDKNFANARDLRNLFESVITNQAARISKEGLNTVEASALQQITAQDFKSLGMEDVSDKIRVKEVKSDKTDNIVVNKENEQSNKPSTGYIERENIRHERFSDEQVTEVFSMVDNILDGRTGYVEKCSNTKGYGHSEFRYNNKKFFDVIFYDDKSYVEIGCIPKEVELWDRSDLDEICSRRGIMKGISYFSHKGISYKYRFTGDTSEMEDFNVLAKACLDNVFSK